MGGSSKYQKNARPIKRSSWSNNAQFSLYHNSEFQFSRSTKLIFLLCSVCRETQIQLNEKLSDTPETYLEHILAPLYKVSKIFCLI